MQKLLILLDYSEMFHIIETRNCFPLKELTKYLNTLLTKFEIHIVQKIPRVHVFLIPMTKTILSPAPSSK